MNRLNLRIILLALTCVLLQGRAVVFVFASDGDASRPSDSDQMDQKSEAFDAMSAIAIPDGWSIDLFAAEPMVANIVAFDIDHRGRVFVCETYRQNQGVTDNRAHDETWLLADLAAQTVQERIDYHRKLLGDAVSSYSEQEDRLRLLIDTDGDGRADQSHVFADGFRRLEEGTGAGVLVRGDDVYYTCIPRLWKLKDENADGAADSSTVLSDGYGVRVAFRGHDLHGLIMGPDGRIYFSIGDRGYHVSTADGKVLANPAVGAVFRCEPDGTALEVYCSGLRNPQELAFNDLGDWFTVDNNSDSGDQSKIFHLLQQSDAGWRMYYQYLADRGPYNEDQLWQPLSPQQPAYIVPPIANLTDGPSGLAFYPGTGFGDELKDHFLVCDFRGAAAQSGVRSFTLQPKGATYELADTAQPIWSVLATDVAFGPDGAIYLSDWVDGWDGVGKGRIYRLTKSQQADSTMIADVASRLSADWTMRETQTLTEDLAHDDRRVRLEAQWELARRQEANALLSVAKNASAEQLSRLHGIWGADIIARRNEEKRAEVLESLRPLLNDTDAVIQAAAAKVAGERGDSKSIPRLIELLENSPARVQYFAAMSLANLKATAAISAVLKMLQRNQNADPALRHAGQVYLSASANADQLTKLKEHPSDAVRQSAVVALRQINNRQVAEFLNDPSEAVQLEAVRAIHDQPILVAQPELAAMIEQPSANLPFLRRVVNANYRLGTPQSAEALAKFAVKKIAPESMRLEALECLQHWETDDPRDRVLNDYRPLADRDPADAKAALTPQIGALMVSAESIREKAIEVAAALGIVEISPTLAARANDTKQSFAARANALRGLAKLMPKQAVAIAKEVRLAPANQLLEAAIEVLAEHDAANSIESFIAVTQSRSMTLKQLGWDILANSDDRRAQEAITEALRRYLAGELSADVHLNVLEAAQGKANAAIDETLLAKLRQHQESLAAGDPLAQWLSSLEGGDIEKGKKLFVEKTELSCVRCHKLNQSGGAIGPELTTIGKSKDRRYLLESICLPDAKIAAGFETQVIADHAGQVKTGILKAETDQYIEIVHSDGTVSRITQDDIVARRIGKSAMPEDLVSMLSPRQLRDLVAFLASLQGDSPAE